METNVNYTIVGAFVITLTAFMVLAIIWLSAGLSTTDYKTYKVYMTESVSGLSKDSTVEFNGVNVGEVTNIEINPENPQMVEVLLNIQKTTPITNGTLAQLSTRGLTGITFIGLQDKGENRTPLEPLKGQKYAIIPTKPSLFLRLDTALTKVTDSLGAVSKSINNLLDQENLRKFKEILVSLDAFTQMLSDNSKNMTTILTNTATATRELAPFIKKGESAMKVFSNETLPAANQAVHTINAITNNIDAVSTDLKRNPSVIIRGKAPRMLGPGER